MKKLPRKRITEIMTEAAVRYYVKKGFSVYPEVGIKSGGNLRADILAINMKGHVSILEIKSCWQDFATDTKWKKYLPFCNQFYFCIPYYLFASDKGQFIRDICKENKVGLFVVGNGNVDYFNLTKDPDGKGGWTTSQNVWLYSVRGSTKTDVCPKLKHWMLLKLAWRGGMSSATLHPVSASVEVKEEYDFDKPITEKQFLYDLDSLDKKRYLKAYPKSSFKKLLKDPKIVTKLDEIKNMRLAK